MKLEMEEGRGRWGCKCREEGKRGGRVMKGRMGQEGEGGGGRVEVGVMDVSEEERERRETGVEEGVAVCEHSLNRQGAAGR